MNEKGNIPRRGSAPKFSDLEIVALSLAAESESIDSGNWLFESKFKEYKGKMGRTGDITHANASLQSPRGLISCSWQRDTTKAAWEINVTIPPRCGC